VMVPEPMADSRRQAVVALIVGNPRRLNRSDTVTRSRVSSMY
jgi:hypothetical protein